MRVRLRRSWTNEQGRKYPIGTVLNVFNSFGKQMIQDGIAYPYDGDYPRVKKEKTEFFKPK
jgi:hypothetical protein